MCFFKVLTCVDIMTTMTAETAVRSQYWWVDGQSWTHGTNGQGIVETNAKTVSSFIWKVFHRNQPWWTLIQMLYCVMARPIKTIIDNMRTSLNVACAVDKSIQHHLTTLWSRTLAQQNPGTQQSEEAKNTLSRPILMEWHFLTIAAGAT